MDLLRLTIDRQNKTLVNYLGSLTSIPAIYQSNKPTLNVYVVDPTGNPLSPYSLVDLNGYGMRVSVGQTPTGTAGGPTPLALQDTFTWVPSGKYFTADLNLAVTTIDNFIGSASSASVYFEVNLTSSGDRSTILQTQLTVKAVVDELTSSAPAGGDRYLTQAESLALFAKKVGSPGERIVLKSANGLYAVELGCNDDGSFMTNFITL